jgi:alkylhydroperoxidase/carboxymuconolactone decarboxylase family protein YurZ
MGVAQDDDAAKQKAIEELVRAATAKRGYKSPWHDYMMKADPEYLATFEGLVDAAMLNSKHLGSKVKQLVVLTTVTTQRDDYAIAEHIRRAFRLGASEGEVLEVIQTAAYHTGALTLVHGINGLLKVKAEEQAPTA